ncbi:zf-HC2 domain-containing protein [candidate division WOR-3 bacterium]|uniref:Zf-HC2 domain-containing protein n=1 Tax=candidate division WOR-3 bacterium TaxID=2052148 RepID=A0A938BQ46_UNCW3|nr:zf-HC2 domain-containing protein [candidate division WOR-3 bacterium]
MKKQKNRTGECHDCDEAEELIARYVGGEEDEELARKLLLHAQTCTECATLLRSLKRLVHYCSLEPTCEMPVTVRRELWVSIRREISSD